MTVLRLNHVQISVPPGAEGQARRFYCGVLGLREVDRPESLRARGGFWLQLGDVQVHLGTEDGVDRRRLKSHVAYEVTDLESGRDKLKAEGLEAADSIPIPGYARFEARDPFGNRIELLEKA